MEASAKEDVRVGPENAFVTYEGGWKVYVRPRELRLLQPWSYHRAGHL